MPLNDWEYSYNGLTFGGATTYGVLRVEGLGPPNTKDDIKQKVTTHGAFVFGNYYEERRIVIDGDILSDPASLQAAVDTWRTTFTPSAIDLPLLCKKPGVVTRRFNCKVMRRRIIEDDLYELGIARWTLEFVAGDPAIYTEDGNTKLFNG